MKNSMPSIIAEIKSSESGNDRLHTLFVNALKDIYWSEKALLKALPKMIRNAASEELTEIFAYHLDETERQVARLEKILSTIPGAVTGRDGENRKKAAPKLTPNEIITYGFLRIVARMLGYRKAADLLQQCQCEEKAGDEKVAEIISGPVLSHR